MTDNKTDLTENCVTQFLRDKDLANILNVSSSWIRKERRLRNLGQDHVLTIDAAYVGSAPRYKKSDVDGWLATL